MNCWAPMPFKRHARIEVVNEQGVPVDAFTITWIIKKDRACQKQ